MTTEARLGLFACLLAAACSRGEGPAPSTRVVHADLGDAPARYTSLLARYLAIDTTNPPGHEARAFSLLSDALEAIGLEPVIDPIEPERGNVWARLAAHKPDEGAGALILLHHIDVVPAEREHWSVDPFGAVEKDGKLFGRGAIDTKVLGVIQLLALERLAKNKGRLRRDVIWLAVSDEEQGGTGAEQAANTRLAEWKAEHLLDEGGYGVRQMMNGRDILVIAVAQKRAGKIELLAKGSAGHGSRPIPDGGPNVLLAAMNRILEQPPPLRLLPTTALSMAKLGELASQPKRFFLQHLESPGVLWLVGGDIAANKNLGPQLRDTMTLTMMAAGQKDNVIPADASAIFDVRLLPDTDADAFLRSVVEKLAGLSVTVSWRVRPPPPMDASPTDDPLFEALVDAGRAHDPGSVVSPWLLIGANDSRFFQPKGVRTYGFLPLYMSPSQIDGIHGHDEHVQKAELDHAYAIYADALERFLLRPE